MVKFSGGVKVFILGFGLCFGSEPENVPFPAKLEKVERLDYPEFAVVKLYDLKRISGKPDAFNNTVVFFHPI